MTCRTGRFPAATSRPPYVATVPTGHYYDHGDYNPSPSATATLTHLGAAGFYPDAFFLKLNDNGGFVWANSVSSDHQDYLTDITLKGSDIYINGMTRGTVDFDFGSGSAPLSVGGFGAKYW